MCTRFVVLLFAAVLMFCSCNESGSLHYVRTKYPSFVSKEEMKKVKPPIEQLIAYTQGTFAINAPGFKSIVSVRRIWPNNGYWVYIEQTANNEITDVLEQSIFHYTEITHDSILAEEYLLPEDKRESFKLGWYHPELFEKLKSSQLIKSPACNLVWTRKPNGDYFGTNIDYCHFGGGKGVGKRVYYINKTLVNADRLGIYTAFYDANKVIGDEFDNIKGDRGLKRVDPRPYYKEAARFFAGYKSKTPKHF